MTDETNIPQLDRVAAVLDGLSDATLLELYRTLLPFDNDMIAAAVARRALEGGGGGSQPISESRDPTNATTNASWTIEITGAPDGGTFTILASLDGGSQVETSPIPFDADDVAVVAALNTALGGTGADASGTGPLPALTAVGFAGDYTGLDVSLAYGSNSLTGGTSPEPVLTRVSTGGTIDDGHAFWTYWFNNDSGGIFIQESATPSAPNWVQQLTHVPTLAEVLQEDNDAGNVTSITSLQDLLGKSGNTGGLSLDPGTGADGGPTILQGGNAAAGGAGGDVRLIVGVGDDGNGNVIIEVPLPIEDPMVVGAIWSDSGVLTMSVAT